MIRDREGSAPQLSNRNRSRIRPRLPRSARTASFRRVDLSSYRRMDPHLLVGLLNTELRNHCDSLDDLVKTHHLDPAVLEKKMAAAGYVYQPELKQFR